MRWGRETNSKLEGPAWVKEGHWTLPLPQGRLPGPGGPPAVACRDEMLFTQ
jgi:hypothetical protein